MNKKEKSTIGIIGGAGPMAGILLAKRIIENCQKVYGCIDDYDYPKMILLSYPFAEMLKPNTGLQEESVVVQELEESLGFLIDSGADYLGIACNTLHGFLNNDCHRDKLVSLIKETELYFSEQKVSTVLVLCTTTSVQKKVYDFPWMLSPNIEEQEYIDDIIKSVLSGIFSSQDSLRLKRFIVSKTTENPNIDGVLLGCTELSVLLDKFPIEVPGMNIIDPLEVLSRKICELIF